MLQNNKRVLICFLLTLTFLFVAPVSTVRAEETAKPGDKNVIVPCDGTFTNKNDQNCDFKALVALFNNIIDFLLFKLAAPLAVLAFVYAGFLYVTAAGDTGKISKAHDIFKSVLIGMILAFGAYLIVTAVLKGLEVDDKFYDQVLEKN